LDDLRNKDYNNLLAAISPLDDLIATYQPKLKTEDVSFIKELILWALVELKLLSKQRFSQGTAFKDPYGSFISGI